MWADTRRAAQRRLRRSSRSALPRRGPPRRWDAARASQDRAIYPRVARDRSRLPTTSSLPRRPDPGRDRAARRDARHHRRRLAVVRQWRARSHADG
jgi:hypothetical protein